ncbi:hypothetical protein CFP56_023674 [Quercus suber]|uniref:Uncharacterized protein n=1 Tax=Quercus suber TaxID=58331 RepID=A0AAW0LY33_QUESU
MMILALENILTLSSSAFLHQTMLQASKFLLKKMRGLVSQLTTMPFGLLWVTCSNKRKICERPAQSINKYIQA